MRLSECLEQFPELQSLYNSDLDAFSSLFNRAVEFVINKVTLYPSVVTLSVQGTHSLGGYLIQSPYGRVKFKEVLDIIAETYADTYLESTESSLDITSFTPSSVIGEVYYANNILSAEKAEVNVIGYIYPYVLIADDIENDQSQYHYDFANFDATNYHLSYSLAYPMIAEMLSLYHLSKYNVSLANTYESICIKYLNMLNKNASYAGASLGSTLLEVSPYDLN